MHLDRHLEREATFAELLSSLRRNRGISQATLAERSGVSARAIGALENATRKAPYRDNVRRLARALQLSPDESARFERAADTARSRPKASTADSGRSVAEVCALLQSRRLITLAGFGGVGKSQLATAVVDHADGRYRHGTYMIDCSHAIDVTDVCRIICDCVGWEQVSGDPLATILDQLESREVLFALDNCEVIVAAIRQFAAAVVSRCAGVSLLVTSRHRLMLTQEFVYTVSPLPNDRSLPLTAADGGRDSNRLDVPCGSLARHASPDANLDWSYRLLEPAERTLLQRLAEIGDEFDARSVMPLGSEVLPTLQSLVDKSLVNVLRTSDGGVRYWLFATTRSYALRKRDESMVAIANGNRAPNMD